MYANEYGGVIARWKKELIAARARRMGFKEHEIPDLQQDIVLCLLEREFDETRASEATFVTRVIDSQLLKELRARKRDARRANYEAASDADVAELASPGMSEVERADLRLDLKAALASLSPQERAVCEALMRGETRAEIARAQGKSKVTIWQTVMRLRKKLRARGLGLEEAH